MSSLQDLVTDALTSTDNDSDLAKALVDCGALAEIIRRGTYDEDTVQKRLSYASPAALRAALSKARRKKGSLPIPVTEGRRWGRTAVNEYQRSRRTPTNSHAGGTPNASDTSIAPSTSTGMNTPVTSGAPTGGNAGVDPIASSSSSGTLGSGTGGVSFAGSPRRDPDQWRNQ